MTTNALFALLLTATEHSEGRRKRMAGGGHVLGPHVGLAGFLVGLLADAELLKQIFTPIMGVSILAAIVGFVQLLVRDEVAGPCPSARRGDRLARSFRSCSP